MYFSDVPLFLGLDLRLRQNFLGHQASCLFLFPIFFGWDAAAQSLMYYRRDALLFFKVIHQMSRSHGLKNRWFKSILSNITRLVAAMNSLRFALFSRQWKCLRGSLGSMNVQTLYPHIRYIGSGNGLVPSGIKPLPEPMLTQIYGAIWRH